MQQKDPRKEPQRSQQDRLGQTRPGQSQTGQRGNLSQNPGWEQETKKKEYSEKEAFKCRECGETFDSQEELDDHESNCVEEK
jgi:hypothetical protein